MIWIKHGLNGKLITWHFSHKDAAGLWYALAVPSSLPRGSGIQGATDFHGLGNSCHPQGEKPSFFDRSPQKSSWTVLRRCTARLLLESPQGTDQREMSRLVIISLFLSKWICTAGAGGFTASYGVIQAAVHAPRRSPESSSRQKWKGRAWITVKYSPVNISKKTGKNSAVTQSGSQHALRRPSEGLRCCYCAWLHWKGHAADCCGLLAERCNPVVKR